MKIFKKLILTIALTAALITPSYAQNTSYDAGQKAMHQQNYQKAYENFKKAETDAKYKEASMYWQAYALFKTRQSSKAKRILKQQLKEFPNGRWSDSAQVLIFENSSKSKRVESPERPEPPERPERPERPELSEDLRLYALEQMFFNNPDKGLPLVIELIEKSNNKQAKFNGLQLLGISDSDLAQDYLYKFIQKSKDKDLSQHAIQMLSMRNNKQSNKMLSNLYDKVQDKQIKSSIIQGFIHSEDGDQLMNLMNKESDKDLNSQIIQLLGIIGAKDKLAELANTLTDLDSKKDLMQALAISGDSQSLIKMIENTKDLELKIEAIESLAIVDEEKIQDYLLDMYSKTKELKIKNALSHAFIVNDVEAKKVIDLIQIEKNLESKHDLLESLIAIGEETELVELYELEKDLLTKQKIIEVLGVQGASEQIISLYANMQELDTKKQALHALAIDGGKASEKFLIKSYKNGDKEIKGTVIESLMIQDSSIALSELLKAETDIELKKKLIQAISMTGGYELLEKFNFEGEENE
jgi:hypothetical protein